MNRKRLCQETTPADHEGRRRAEVPRSGWSTFVTDVDHPERGASAYFGLRVTWDFGLRGYEECQAEQNPI